MSQMNCQSSHFTTAWKSDTSSKALIVDDDTTTRYVLKSLLKKQGYATIEAANGQDAIDLFKREQPDIIFMDVVMPGVDGYEATRQIKAESGTRFIPIIFITALGDQQTMLQCIEAGGDDILIKPYEKSILQAKIQSMLRIASLNQDLQCINSMFNREQEIAESFYKNAIQRANIENSFIKSKIRPAAIFSGDMVLSAYSPSRDLLFLIGDFTGHGLSSSLCAMPVSEVFRAMAAKGFSPEEILSGINRKLKLLLPVGMFFGAQLVSINQDLEHVVIFNAGMPDLLVVDGMSNSIKHKVKSRGLPLGVIDDIQPREIAQYVAINPNDKILMFSDGLIEARNGDDVEFDEQRLEQAITNAAQNCIFEKIYEDLDAHCGNTPQVDDVTLAEITCVPELLPEVETAERIPPIQHNFGNNDEWEVTLKFRGARLRETNPVPILINYIMDMEALEAERQSLFTVITELYVNALDHGLLGLDSSLKSDPSGFASYFEERENRLATLDSGHVVFHLAFEQKASVRSILLRVEDSGEGFDYANYQSPAPEQMSLCGRGIVLIKDLCESFEYQGKGNVAEAVYSWNAG